MLSIDNFKLFSEKELDGNEGKLNLWAEQGGNKSEINSIPIIKRSVQLFFRRNSSVFVVVENGALPSLLYKIEMKGIEIDVKLISKGIKGFNCVVESGNGIFVADDLFGIMITPSSQKLLLRMKTPLVDIRIESDIFWGVDSEGTVKGVNWRTWKGEVAFCTGIQAIHLLSKEYIAAFSDEIYIFDLKNNLLEKKESEFGKCIEILENNEAYALVRFEKETKVWDHENREFVHSPSFALKKQYCANSLIKHV